MLEFPKMLKRGAERLIVADQAEQDVAADSGWLTSAQVRAALEAPAAAPESLAAGVAEVLEELVESVAPRRGRPRKA